MRYWSAMARGGGEQESDDRSVSSLPFPLPAMQLVLLHCPISAFAALSFHCKSRLRTAYCQLVLREYLLIVCRHWSSVSDPRYLDFETAY